MRPAVSSQVSDDGAESEQALYDVVYQELRLLARRQRRALAAGATINTTALVHEAYFKLRGAELSLARRAQFFGAAARAMRQVLVDFARRRGARKRGADFAWTGFDEDVADREGAAADPALTDILALDAALGELRRLEPELATLVDWHVFAGLGMPQIAELRDVAERTVFRDWRRARAFLLERLG